MIFGTETENGPRPARVCLLNARSRASSFDRTCRTKAIAGLAMVEFQGNSRKRVCAKFTQPMATSASRKAARMESVVEPATAGCAPQGASAVKLRRSTEGALSHFADRSQRAPEGALLVGAMLQF